MMNPCQAGERAGVRPGLVIPRVDDRQADPLEVGDIAGDDAGTPHPRDGGHPPTSTSASASERFQFPDQNAFASASKVILFGWSRSS